MRQGITEQALRDALKRELGRVMGPRDVLLEELNVELGSVRADVVVAGNLLEAFEIKSDFDTFDRLARQMHAYHRVFDRVTLATTRTFMPVAEQLLPSWWGLMLAEAVDNDLRLIPLRAAALNPRQEVQEVARLLWRDEAMAVARTISPEKVRLRSTREELCELVASSGSIGEVRQWVVQSLKERLNTKAPQEPLRPAMSAA